MIKIFENHINRNPNFIYKTTAFDLKLYDRVYENWHRPDHESWEQLEKQNQLRIKEKFDNKESYQYIGDQNWVGYIFFKDRTDRRHIQITFGEISKEYKPNTLLIIDKSYKIKFSKPESPMPDKPFLVVEFDDLFLKTIDKFF